MENKTPYNPGQNVLAGPWRGRDGGDGGGPGMEARIDALEKKLDKIDQSLVAISSDMAFLKGVLTNAPSAKDFGELKGRVDSLPTTNKVAGLLAIAVAVLTIIGKWGEIQTMLSTVYGH